MGKAVEEKREWHRIWSKSKTEANKMVYNQIIIKNRTVYQEL